jgi:hypothetical protein
MKINYLAEYPQLDFTNPESDNLVPLITKSCEWSYEDEYRVVALEKFMTVPVPGMLRTKENFLKFPRGVLKAVITGCMIAPSDAAELRSIIGQQLPRHAALKRAIRVPNRYSLSIETASTPE